MVFFKVRNRIKLTVIFCTFCSLKAKTKQSKTKTQKNLHLQRYFVFDDKEFLIHTKLSLLGHKFKCGRKAAQSKNAWRTWEQGHPEYVGPRPL